jgi:hypothetical protein
MHTDEYEISLTREINICQRVVNETWTKLDRRRQRFGMNYPEASRAATEGRLIIDGPELTGWREDFEALPQWEQRLEQYREALAVLRISASHF